MDQPTLHYIHSDQGPEQFYGTIQQVSELQDIREARKSHYNIAYQLDCLYKDIEAGKFGPDAKQGMFAQYIRNIKQQFPKPGDSV